MFSRTKSDHSELTARQLEDHEAGQQFSLAGATRGTKADKSVRWIPLEKITTRQQVREHFDEESLNELAASFQEHGQQQACRVFFSDEEGKFVIVAGERRYRAAKIAGFDSLKCDILDHEPTPQELHELQIIENVQREDLNPLEEAKAYQRFVDEFGYSQTEIAKKTGKSQPTISRALKLLQMPEDVQRQISAGDIAKTLIPRLLKVKDPEEQRAMIEDHKSGNLTVRDAAEKTSSSSGRSGSKAAAKTRTKKSRGVELSAKLKKAHTNTDLALATLDWCSDLIADRRSNIESDALRERLEELLGSLDGPSEERRAA